MPSIEQGNNDSHAIGLGQMNLHGYLARERIFYGSEEGMDFTNIYFYTVLYHALRASNRIAIERGVALQGLRELEVRVGGVLRQVHRAGVGAEDRQGAPAVRRRGHPHSDARGLAQAQGVGGQGRHLQPEPAGGAADGVDLLHQPLDVVDPPGGQKVEIRKEGKIGRVYYPAPYMTNDNLEYYEDAYEIGYEKIIDTYAAATEHVDQGLSLTLFFKDTATTRDVNKAQIYAWRKGIKTLYYIRLRQMALQGTEVENCVSCML